MRILVLTAVAVALMALLAALQVLARATRALPFEAFLRPLRTPVSVARMRPPAELAALESLVTDALQGDRGAALRLADRLAAAGSPVDGDPTPASLHAALRRLAGPLRA